MHIEEHLLANTRLPMPLLLGEVPAANEMQTLTHHRLAERFGITSEFIRVPALSKMLGISSNAIYAQIRAETFPIRHKRVGNLLLVRLIDFVEWYCDPEAGATVSVREQQSEPVESASPNLKKIDEASAVDGAVAASLLSRSETSKEWSDRIKSEVIADMKRRHGRGF